MFENICGEYISKRNDPSCLSQLEKIQGGESLKKFYKFNGDNVNYLLIDFSMAEENALHFVNMTNKFFDESYCFPKIYYHKECVVITEFVDGETLEFISNKSVRHKLIRKVNFKCIDWICNFKKSSCNIVDKQKCIGIWKKISNEKLYNLMNISKCCEYEEKITSLVDDIYSNSNICMCHNDFIFTNIMWCDDEKNIKIIDYHDCGYNIEHYDIASLLYHPKKYFSHSEREELLNYYYDRLESKPSYDDFISIVSKTAFIRIARSLDLRFKKYLDGDTSVQLLAEIRKGLNCLKELESYVNIHISDGLKSLLPENIVYSISLCAGFGKRMRSNLPKCATKILNVPMINYISNALESFCCNQNLYVVGYRKDIMKENIMSYSNNCIFVDQDEQLGTGHAVNQTVSYLKDDCTCFVVMGDMPVITYDLLLRAYKYHKESGSVSTIVSANLKQVNTNGKIIKDEFGNFKQILEYNDIDILYPPEQAILMKSSKEVNTGLYIFETTELKKYLPRIDNNNPQQEYYLTDVIKLQKMDNLKISCMIADDLCEPTGANTYEELQKIEQVFCK